MQETAPLPRNKAPIATSVAKAHHLGGAISPGRAMRYNAMHVFTANLPLLNPTDEVPAVGTSTSSSMSLGVEAGIISEIQAHIEAFTQNFGDFTIIYVVECAIVVKCTTVVDCTIIYNITFICKNFIFFN